MHPWRVLVVVELEERQRRQVRRLGWWRWPPTLEWRPAWRWWRFLESAEEVVKAMSAVSVREAENGIKDEFKVDIPYVISLVSSVFRFSLR